MTRATNLHGQAIQLGPVCELTPVVEGSEVDLSVKATLTELDAGNPAGYRERVVADTRVRVPVQGGAMVYQAATGADSDKRVVLIVKPTILGESTPVRPAAADPGDPDGGDCGRRARPVAGSGALMVRRIVGLDPSE